MVVSVNVVVVVGRWPAGRTDLRSAMILCRASVLPFGKVVGRVGRCCCVGRSLAGRTDGPQVRHDFMPSERSASRFDAVSQSVVMVWLW